MAIFEGEKMVEEGKDETGVARDRGVADPFFFRPAAFALKGCGVRQSTPVLRSLCGSKQHSSR